MKKLFTMFSLLLLLVSTILPAGWQTSKVEAAAAEEAFEAGTYTIPVQFLQETKDEESKMQDYVGVGDKEDKVDVTISEETNEVKLTLTSANFISDFGINGKSLEPKSKDDTANTVTYVFEVDDLKEMTLGFVSIDVPNVYSKTHQIRIQFDTSDIPLQQAEPEGNAVPIFFWHAEKYEESSMQKYVNEGSEGKAIITEENGTTYAQITLTGANLITNFGVNEQSAEIVAEDDVENTRTYKFPVSDLDEMTEGFVEVMAGPRGPMAHKIRVYFNETPAFDEVPIFFWHAEKYEESSMQSYVNEGSDGQAIITEENGTTYAQITLTGADMITDFGVNEQSAEIVAENDTKNTRTYKFPVSDLDGMTDGFVEVMAGPRGPMAHKIRVYFNETPAFDEVPIFFWHAKEDKESSMQGYVNEGSDGQAIITEENGTTYAQITLTGADMITDFGVNEQSAEIVAENNTKETRTYKFPISDLDGMTDGFVEVMAGPRGPMAHKIRIYFNEKPVFEKPKEEPKKDETDGIYEDGEYDLPVTFYKEDGALDENNVSSMDSYVVREKSLKSSVLIKDGQAEVSIPMKSEDMIVLFKVDDQEVKREVLKDNDENVAKFIFDVENLDEVYDGFVQIRAIVNGTVVHEGEHDMRISFDTSHLKLKDGKKSPDKDKDKSSKKKKQKTKQSKLLIDQNNSNLDDDYPEGTYSLPVFIFKDTGSLTKDNLSMMHTEYLVEDKSTVYFEKGKDPLVTIVLKNANLIQSFTVEGQEAKRVNLHGPDEEASFTFAVKDLNAIVNGHIVIDIGSMIMPHDIRIGFDTSNIPGAGNNGSGPLGTFLGTGDGDLTFDRFADGDVAPLAANVEKPSVNPKTNDVNYSKMTLFALLFLVSTIFLGLWLRSRFVKSV